MTLNPISCSFILVVNFPIPFSRRDPNQLFGRAEEKLTNYDEILRCASLEKQRSEIKWNIFKLMSQFSIFDTGYQGRISKAKSRREYRMHPM
jgi:hypothetical protein